MDKKKIESCPLLKDYDFVGACAARDGAGIIAIPRRSEFELGIPKKYKSNREKPVYIVQVGKEEGYLLRQYDFLELSLVTFFQEPFSSKGNVSMKDLRTLLDVENAPHFSSEEIESSEINHFANTINKLCLHELIAIDKRRGGEDLASMCDVLVPGRNYSSARVWDMRVVEEGRSLFESDSDEAGSGKEDDELGETGAAHE